MNIMNKKNPVRQLVTAFLLAMLAFTLSAQEKADSVLTFRFLAGRDMFFVPLQTNSEELARLFDCVEEYRDMITGHDVFLHVDGYCNSKGSTAQKLGIARIRSNRVKSELITRKGLTEDCFVTHNHAEEGDFVTVRVIPREGIQLTPQETTAETQNEVDITDESQPDTDSDAQQDNTVDETSDELETDDLSAQSEPDTSAQQPAVADAPVALPLKNRGDTRLALKTNLLDYVALMPNLEIEWMFKDRWSVALEAQGAWYAKNSPRKIYRLATVMPEVRFWAIDRSRWHGMYVGIFGGAGLYELANSTKGHEGEGAMAGVSAGYMWPISKHLSLDAGIGVGYLRIRDKVYIPLDGHALYQFTKNINYFGPLRLKLSLVWRIPK